MLGAPLPSPRQCTIRQGHWRRAYTHIPGQCLMLSQPQELIIDTLWNSSKELVRTLAQIRCSLMVRALAGAWGRPAFTSLL